MRNYTMRNIFKWLKNSVVIMTIASISYSFADNSNIAISDPLDLVNYRIAPNSGKELNVATYSSDTFAAAQENKGCSALARGPQLVKFKSLGFKSRYFEVRNCTLRSVHFSIDTLYIIDDEIDSLGIKQTLSIYHFSKSSIKEILAALNLQNIIMPLSGNFFSSESNDITGGRFATDAGVGTFESTDMLRFNSSWNGSLVSSEGRYQNPLLWSKPEFQKLFNKNQPGFLLIWTQRYYL